MNNKGHSGSEQYSEINIQEVITPYLKKWYWFVISALIILSLAYLYIKSSSTIYKISSSVLIKDAKKSGGIAGDFGVLQDLSSLSGMGTNSIDNEIEIFKSKKLMRDVVRELKLNTKIFSKLGMAKTELYKDTSPIIIQVINEKPYVELPEKPINIKITGNEIELSSEELPNVKTGFNRTISLPYANIMILRNKDFNPLKIKKIGDLSFVYSNEDGAVTEYNKAVNVDLLDKDATVIGLVTNQNNIDKAKDILKSMVKSYNYDALNDKNSESKKSQEFINERIGIIAKELGNVETEKENFKKANNITDIPTEAQLNLETLSQAQKKDIELEGQLDITNSLMRYLSSQGNGEVLPVNIGVDINSEDIISQYNLLVIERNRLLENATPQNPLVIDINKKINSMRSSLMQSLQKSRSAILLTKNQFDGERNKLTSKISKIPTQEKIFRNIERQQRIKEELYLLLLQKREETAISLAMTPDKARVVDYPYVDDKPVSPKKMIIMLCALIFGSLLPILFIYLKELLNNKVRNRNDIEKIADISVLSEIPKVNKKDGELVQVNDNSPNAEAFRILATNLNYMIPKLDKGKVIFVTSSIKGEGKTFVAINLALSLANSNRKAILIGSDIRNPQLQRYNEERKNSEGLSEFLYNSERSVKSLIHKSIYNPHLDVIYSGTIPPNPTELLTNGRFQKLIEELRTEYDYMIVDTAPLMLVTDTFLIADQADVIAYVIRSNYSDKKLIEFAEKSKKDKKIKNIGFVLNDISPENYGYGSKYGYGYGHESKTFFQKLKDEF